MALLTLGDPLRVTGGYLYHRRMAEFARQCKASIRFYSLPARPFPLPSLATLPLLSRIRESDTDVLVIDSIVAEYMNAYSLFGHQLPMVGSLHQPAGGMHESPLLAPIRKQLDLQTYRWCHRLIVASELLASELMSDGVPRNKMDVVPPGRDLATPSTDHPQDLSRGRQIALLCVGNWLENKGITEVLDALACLADPTATLHLVGDTEVDRKYSERVWARIKEPQLEKRVIVHGVLPPREVAALYRDSDVFVLPSVREAYGTVYGEALAFGLPIIGWRIGNLPYIASGSSAVLLEPGDVDGLASAIGELADNPEKRLEMSNAALLSAESLPTWRASAAQFFAFLRGVVDNQPWRLVG